MGTDNGRSFGFTGPGGWGIQARGADVVTLLLAAGIISIVLYQGVLTRQEHALLIEEMQIQSHLISLPPEARPVMMPPPAYWRRLQRRQGDQP